MTTLRSRGARRSRALLPLLLATAVASVPTAAAAAPAGALPATPAATSAGPDADLTVEGRYSVVLADPPPADAPPLPEPDEAVRRYLLTDDGGRVLLDGDDEVFAGLEPGQDVEVSGATTTSGGEEVLQVAEAEALAPAPEVGTTGTRSAVVVLLRRGPDGREPMTVEQARANVFTGPDSVSAFFAESSFGQMRLVGADRTDGDVVGYLEIPADTPCYSEGEAGAVAAAAAGVDVTRYDHVVYAVDPSATSCPYGGWAYVGGTVSVNMLYGDASFRGVVQHELGHNLGLWHAHSLLCTAGDGGWASVADGAGGSCSIDEYGDRFDTMGDAYNHMHYSANHKVQLGWIPQSRVVTAEASGTFTIATAGVAGTRPQSLRIPIRDGAWYDVDVRRPVGTYWDAKVANIPALANGVEVRLVDERGQSVVDTTPDGWMYDAPLQGGQAFTDPVAGITIRVRSVDATSAQVEVTLPRVLPQVHLRGTHNAWGSTAMTKVAGTSNTWSADVRFGATGSERFKFDVNADWSENYGDSNRDGRVERNGADIPVTDGEGTYRVTFDATAGTYTVTRTSFRAVFATMNVRGTHNAWGTTPMTLVGDNTWKLTTWLGGTDDARLKFDVDGTWATNFGDGDRNGTWDRNGADIPVTGGAGLYDVVVDDRTGRYTFTKWG